MPYNTTEAKEPDGSVAIPYIDFCKFSYNKNLDLLSKLVEQKIADNTLAIPSEEVTKIIRAGFLESKMLTGDESSFFIFIAKQLTPFHIKLKRDFDREKYVLYQCDCRIPECEHTDEFYNNPENLSVIGKLSVFVELQRMELKFLKNFDKNKYLSLTGFLVFYLYNLPKGYNILNTLFWDEANDQPKATQVDFVNQLLQLFRPESLLLQDPLYNYLIEHLTPRHFLNDRSFTEQKKYFYVPLIQQDASIDDSRYSDPVYLTALGRLRVFIELKRLEERFLNKFSKIYNRLASEVEPFLSKQQFLAIYLYSTNLGYKNINSYLRNQSLQCDLQQHQCDPANYFGAYEVRQIIEFINTGLNRLNASPKCKLNNNERKLIRYSDLPEDLLRDIITSTTKMNAYLDKAFLSTSFNAEGAEGFAIRYNFKLVIRTYGANIQGAKINGISAMSEEDEFLLNPGVKLTCHPADSLIYDDKKKICTVNVSAVNIHSVVSTALALNKAKKTFMQYVERFRQRKKAALSITSIPDTSSIDLNSPIVVSSTYSSTCLTLPVIDEPSKSRARHFQHGINDTEKIPRRFSSPVLSSDVPWSLPSVPLRPKRASQNLNQNQICSKLSRRHSAPIA